MKTHKIKRSKNRELYEFLMLMKVPTTRISKIAEASGEHITPSMIWKYKKDVLEKTPDGELNPIEFLNKLILKYIDENAKIKLDAYNEKAMLYLLLLHRLGKIMKQEEKVDLPLPTTDRIIELIDKVLSGLYEIEKTDELKKIEKVEQIQKFMKYINKVKKDESTKGNS